ncbi:MAG: hypothetical protein LBJ12_05495 [Oscillospiraceae bacterium]|jgi:hypothetical protein|nr:hypothetical protein [Oscillospiraceae bacterium]
MKAFKLFIALLLCVVMLCGRGLFNGRDDADGLDADVQNPPTKEFICDGVEFVLRLLWEGLPAGEGDIIDNDDWNKTLWPVDVNWKFRSAQAIETELNKYLSADLFKRFSTETTNLFETDVALRHYYSPESFVTKDGVFYARNIVSDGDEFFHYHLLYSQMRLKMLGNGQYVVGVPYDRPGYAGDEYGKDCDVKEVFFITVNNGKFADFRWLGLHKQAESLPDAKAVNSVPEDMQRWLINAVKAERLLVLAYIDCDYSDEKWIGNDEYVRMRTFGHYSEIVNAAEKYIDKDCIERVRDSREGWFISPSKFKEIDGKLYYMVPRTEAPFYNFQSYFSTLLEDKAGEQEYLVCVDGVSGQSSFVLTVKNGKVINKEWGKEPLLYNGLT